MLWDIIVSTNTNAGGIFVSTDTNAGGHFYSPLELLGDAFEALYYFQVDYHWAKVLPPKETRKLFLGLL